MQEKHSAVWSVSVAVVATATIHGPPPRSARAEGDFLERVLFSSGPLRGPDGREHGDRDVIVHVGHARQPVVGRVVPQGGALVERADRRALQPLVDLHYTRAACRVGVGCRDRERERKGERDEERIASAIIYTKGCGGGARAQYFDI